MTEKYKQAVRNTLTAEAAERLIAGDKTATDDAGFEAIEAECVRLTREELEKGNNDLLRQGPSEYNRR